MQGRVQCCDGGVRAAIVALLCEWRVTRCVRAGTAIRVFTAASDRCRLQCGAGCSAGVWACSAAMATETIARNRLRQKTMRRWHGAATGASSWLNPPLQLHHARAPTDPPRPAPPSASTSNKSSALSRHGNNNKQTCVTCDPLVFSDMWPQSFDCGRRRRPPCVTCPPPQAAAAAARVTGCTMVAAAARIIGCTIVAAAALLHVFTSGFRLLRA